MTSRQSLGSSQLPLAKKKFSINFEKNFNQHNGYGVLNEKATSVLKNRVKANFK